MSICDEWQSLRFFSRCRDTLSANSRLSTSQTTREWSHYRTSCLPWIPTYIAKILLSTSSNLFLLIWTAVPHQKELLLWTLVLSRSSIERSIFDLHDWRQSRFRSTSQLHKSFIQIFCWKAFYLLVLPKLWTLHLGLPWPESAQTLKQIARWLKTSAPRRWCWC